MFSSFRNKKSVGFATSSASRKLRCESLEQRALLSILANGSFETPALPSPPYAQYNPSGAVWVFQDRAGMVSTPSPDWTFEPPTPAPDGIQLAFLQCAHRSVSQYAQGAFSQTITLPSDGVYTLYYQAGGRQKADYSGVNHERVDGDLSYQILIDSQLIASDATYTYQSFTPKSYSFSAQAGEHTLIFKGTNTVNDHTGFFDAIRIEGKIDIAATDLQWDTAQGGVEFSYQVTGANLTQNTTAELYWASGPNKTDLGLAAPSVPIPKTTPLNQTITVPVAISGNPPAGATHLVLVVDPPLPNGIISESREDNNIKALALQPDIIATDLQWDTVQGGVDFGYQVTGADLPQTTSGGLYWSSDTTFDVGDLLASPQSFTINIGQQTYNKSIPLADLQNPPIGTKYLLLAVDRPDDRIKESHEDNNVCMIRLSDLAQVGPMSTSHDNLPPDSPYPYNVDSTLVSAVEVFRQSVIAEPGSQTFSENQGYRSYERQEHFWEINQKFRALTDIDGIEGYVTVSNNPQLRFRESPPPSLWAVACEAVVHQVNTEVTDHGLQANRFGRPAVNPPEASAHTRSPAEAVDISITGLSPARIDELAEAAGLWRPYQGDDVHFQLLGSQVNVQAVIQGDCPINILVQDPLGNRIGFDPIAGISVNEVGSLAEYSGQDSEPQIVLLQLGSVVTGEYRIFGVGTGSGPYAITVRLFGEDDLVNPIYNTVVASGVAEFGQPLEITRGLELVRFAIGAPVLDPIGDQTVYEGTQIISTVTTSELAKVGSPTFTLDSAPLGATIDPTSGIFTWTPQDGPTTAQVTVRVTDNGTPSLSDTTTFTITVNNLPPIITSLSNSSPQPGGASEGKEVTALATFADPGVADTHTATIDWGDGSVTPGGVVETNGSGTVQTTHVYTQGGIYVITMTVTDDDGDSTTQTTKAIVSGAGLHDGVLQIIGSNRDDHVVVKEDRRGHLIVDANFIKGCHSRLFEADRVERIDVQLYDGDDFASFHNSVHLPGLIDGGSGDDVLMGGSGNTILVGGDGNDLLIGGRGRNLIIGGLGADLLMAGAGEDILIAGRTAFDANSVALLKIMDEWTSSHDYNTRVKNLRGDDNSGFANRSNGNYFLQARGENRTVFDDKSRDVLVGGSQRDWFFANYNAKEKKKQDLISGWKFFETIENLDS